MNYDWAFINTFAPWFSAIGTISAVIVSLFLAQKDKPKLKIDSSIRLMISEAIDGNPEYLVIEVVNIGIRPTKIVAIGWTIGLFRKKSFIQIVGKGNDDLVANLYSSDFPIVLNDGEEAKWLIPLDEENNWIDRFKTNLSWFAKWDLLFTNLEVYTAHGLKYKKRIAVNIRSRLLEALKE